MTLEKRATVHHTADLSCRILLIWIHMTFFANLDIDFDMFVDF